ncbi:MAG TPA: hypothetical protein VK891_17700, partial [Euzebyales bacterium]|nr:hypothetical protein [Euzebyales bacterium]
LSGLLAAPGSDVHALELAGARVAEGRAEPLIDQKARAAYGTRLRDLADDLAEADAHHDVERAAALRHELEFLEHELAAATGLGGRDRTTTTQAERARVAVTKAIRTAIRNIGAHDDAVGRYLDVSVQTGRFCRYMPPPGSVLWSPTVRP